MHDDPGRDVSRLIAEEVHLMPRRLDVPEWQHTQDYWSEKDVFPAIDLDDGCLVYE